ncbi:hypothetical protein [Bradyrhizobium sp.]|uniref:hypothetical protein n=1 Tax=Bradyrhizobium sp. TaxID=376 RepID=UPI0025B94461|nr:hypothetical protein [Bradyrhizobium sp.]
MIDHLGNARQTALFIAMAAFLHRIGAFDAGQPLGDIRRSGWAPLSCDIIKTFKH